MNEVRLDSHYGQDDIAIEQCPNCGTLWFDALELQRTKRGEAATIDTQFDSKVYQNSPHSKHQTHKCPIDSTSLEPLTGLHIAEDLAIETCPTCQGILLNPGEFFAFQGEAKQARQDDFEYRQEYMPIALDSEITQNLTSQDGVGFGKAYAKDEYEKLVLEEEREKARRRALRRISPERYLIEVFLDFIIPQFNRR